MLRITNLGDARRVPMGDRGERVVLVDADAGARNVDVHVNILRPSGPGGRYHYHPNAENVYIVLSGTGRFVADGEEHILEKDDVVFIPPHTRHSLSQRGEAPLVLIEIYAPVPVETRNVD